MLSCRWVNRSEPIRRRARKTGVVWGIPGQGREVQTLGHRWNACLESGQETRASQWTDAVGQHMGNLKKFIGPMVLTIVTLFVINRVKVIRDLVYPAA